VRGSGDGFVRCSDGHVRWGRFGAAGVLFVHRGGDATRVMLQKRSAWAHEGGSWSVAGGAVDAGETPEQAALREAAEEVGEIPEHRLVGQHVFAPADDWSYTTLVAEVDDRFGDSINFETDAVAWFTADEVDRLACHAGFLAAWPRLREIVDELPAS
jgi:8-oxo-dGTP diphosphatase